MAVSSTRVQSAMVINFKAGVDNEGKDIIKGQRFSKIKVNASDNDILLAGIALGSLLKNEFVNVVREDESIVINE